MGFDIIRIGADDRDRHEAFFRYVPKIFRTVDFRRWAGRGGWDADYTVFALTAGGEIVAAIGRTRMQLRVDGAPVEGYQLGAVGTLPAHRGQGLSRRLMEEVIGFDGGPEQPILLFANPTVLDFYPRFGFRRVTQQHFRAARPLRPAGPPLRRLDLDDPAERRALQALCAGACHHGGGLGAGSYHSTLLWHLTYRPLAAHWLDDGAGLIVTGIQRDAIVLHDVIAAAAPDLAAVLPRAVDRAVGGIRFGFDPAGWWPDAEPAGDDASSLLFLRGTASPRTPFRFPDLAQT